MHWPGYSTLKVPLHLGLFRLHRENPRLAIQSAELVVHEAGSRAAELIFGSLDGLFSVLGIIAAAGSAQLLSPQIFTTGLGGAVAGALSVFASTFFLHAALTS